MDEEEGTQSQLRGQSGIGLSSSSSSHREELASDTTPFSNRGATKEEEEEEEDRFDDEDDVLDEHEIERAGFLGTKHDDPLRSAAVLREEEADDGWLYGSIWYKTLLPDSGITIRGYPLIEASGFCTKFLKFVVGTLGMIVLVHIVVAHLFDDRDKILKLIHIWRYELDLIVRDCLVFFVVGRMWEKPGIDHLAWMGTAIASNIYFESQNFIWFLQHSVTLFQMHCLWPWELWIFALILVVSASGLVLAHAIKAWNDRILFVKLAEMGLCVFFFMAPMITSDYFHMHHWYAGWLMGMQFNYNVWWSRLSMAWCWGMYVNGIAVYGRDPVLTCEYAYFLTVDNRCPYISCYLEGLADKNNTSVKEMVPVDWRNCSATDDFHP